LELLDGEMRRNADTVPWLVLVTDGRANVGLAGGLGSEDARAAAGRLKVEKINTLVVDTTERGSATARELALVAGGEYVCLRAASGAAIAGAVRQHVTD
jgi:magnesium chelatase subunit D